MELPEMVEFVRKYSVMVRINGPDPKGLKMVNHAFHLYNSGKTTLSASGLLLPRNLRKVDCGNCESGAVVVTVASVVEPFLSQKSKMNFAQGVPELIPGAQIDVLVEVTAGGKPNPTSSNNENAKWFGARVLKLVDVPASSSAIQALAEASSGSSEHRWEVGWSLSARSDSSHKYNGSEQAQANIIGSSSDIQGDGSLTSKAAARIALLLLPSLLEDLPEVMVSATNKRGSFLLSSGSPFGILSPLHFFNSISVGSVANCYPSVSVDKSILMADIRCLPGTEGGPIFGQNGSLVGILNRPLRQTGGTEIQVVIPWRAIESACTDLIQPVCRVSDGQLRSTGSFTGAMSTALNFSSASNFIENHLLSCCSAPLAVEQAMNSVCLITLDDGVWASGILLNKQGLILTNAHLVEPWRFGRTTIQSGRAETSPKHIFTSIEDSMPAGLAKEQKSEVMQFNASVCLDNPSKNRAFQPFHQVNSQIRARVDLMDSWLWLNATILFVSRGPLDISLLQLESVPYQLCPIGVDLTCPSPGSKAFVIGHGLLGPRCDLLPSISSGVVAKVVKAKMSEPHPADLQEGPVEDVPVMLETTASVHPGSSGGVVVNSAGNMVALVTSNAKHSGGTVIPHMNFSIPSAALEPVFLFARGMQNTSLLQQLDRPNTELASVWAMMPKISPEPHPLLRGVNDLLGKEKQVKGSRFAKFINDKQELVRKARQINTTNDLSPDTIPSKL